MYQGAPRFAPLETWSEREVDSFRSKDLSGVASFSKEFFQTKLNAMTLNLQAFADGSIDLTDKLCSRIDMYITATS